MPKLISIKIPSLVGDSMNLSIQVKKSCGDEDDYYLPDDFTDVSNMCDYIPDEISELDSQESENDILDDNAVRKSLTISQKSCVLPVDCFLDDSIDIINIYSKEEEGSNITPCKNSRQNSSSPKRPSFLPTPPSYRTSQLSSLPSSSNESEEEISRKGR